MYEKIVELIEQKRFSEARECLLEMNEVDIAEIFTELEKENIIRLFRLLPKDIGAEVFAHMDSDVQQNVIEALTDKELSAVLDDMYLDDTVDLLEEMPASVVKRVLKNSTSEMRKLINQFLSYPEDSAGSLMTIEYVDLKRNMTVSEAFNHIRKTGIDKETIYTCYVHDERRVLEGTVSVRELLLAQPDEVVSNLMDTHVIFAYTYDPQEEVALKFHKYGLLSLPVVDKEHRLVGIVTVDDAVEVIQEENTEDFEKMAAITPSDDTYLKTSVFKHAQRRVLWLLILMVSATITGIIITNYEEAFAAMPILVSFLPMLMDTGGNCGNQTSTLIIRGMALGEIEWKDFFKVMFKELRIALLVGFALMLANIANVWIRTQDFLLSVTVGISLYCTVCIAKLLGFMLPMLAKKIKLDPAIMASPIITTITDACAVLIYFNLATWILKLSI